MFARVICVKTASDKASEVRRIWEERLLAALKAQPGFVSARLLASADAPGEAMHFSIWESQEAYEAAAQSQAVQQAWQLLTAQLSEAAASKSYEVISQS